MLSPTIPYNACNSTLYFYHVKIFIHVLSPSLVGILTRELTARMRFRISDVMEQLSENLDTWAIVIESLKCNLKSLFFVCSTERKAQPVRKAATQILAHKKAYNICKFPIYLKFIINDSIFTSRNIWFRTYYTLAGPFF